MNKNRIPVNQIESCIYFRSSLLLLLLFYFTAGCGVSDQQTETQPEIIKKFAVATGSKLLSVNLDGSEVNDFIEPGGHIFGVFVDYNTNQCYYANIYYIGKYDLAAGTQDTLVDRHDLPDFEGYPYFTDVTINLKTNQLYFCEKRNSVIYRANLDGSEIETIVEPSGIPNNSTGIIEIELDMQNGKLFWINSEEGAIYKSDFDGSNIRRITELRSLSTAFTINPNSQRIYWSSADEIWTCSYDGELKTMLFKENLYWITGLEISIEKEKIYWTDTWYWGPTDYDSKLYVSDFDFSEVKCLHNFGPSSIWRPIFLSLIQVAEEK